MNDDTILEVKDLHIKLKSDGVEFPIVEGVSFELKAGKVLALVGESGCGKSVTSASILRLLPRELDITSGQIQFRPPGSDKVVNIVDLPKEGKGIRHVRGNQIAMIFQEPMSSFSPLHTIGNQVSEVVRLHLKVSKKEARARTVKMLDKVGISDPDRAFDQYPYEFSGGMRQRAMIAKALSCNPSVLIADEPTTALDVTIQAQVLDLMRELRREMGMAIVFITHDLGVVAQIADDVAIMYMGRIVEQGPVREIFANPRHPYTVNLLRAVPRLGNLRDRQKLTPIQGSVPSLFDRPTGCTFHPRCSAYIKGTCEASVPPMVNISEHHSVRCFSPEATAPVATASEVAT
ncbi:MAG: ABC transporter ATP-binding protein [Rhodobacteraceae bacterium]|nr:ABC transporter ATP-binding protein [Paracoccaceae bacterium]